ncbi:MAG: ABC transporter permease subunit [Clostridia bacterium]|nr:ABC transporter permease subunit [Clostridia bacterium]
MKNAQTRAVSVRKEPAGLKIRKFFLYVKSHPMLYIMLIPGLFFLILYKFLPLYGILMAFQDYNIFAGANPIDAIAHSPWVGLKHFERLFASSNFIKVLSNTFIINGMKIIVLFPLPIICAILLNEIRRKNARKLLQTTIYVPYFFSWVIVFGIFYSLLGTHGIVNSAIAALGLNRIHFFTDQGIFRWLLVFTEGWKEIGYNTVIYMAAITGIDIGLYEAGKIDGANKWQLIWHITLPGILPTIVLMLILKVGYILDTGFEQVLIFYNAAVYDVADIIQTYVYRLGMGSMNFSQSTALGLFNSVVAFILIVGANTVSKKMLNRSIW